MLYKQRDASRKRGGRDVGAPFFQRTSTGGVLPCAPYRHNQAARLKGKLRQVARLRGKTGQAAGRHPSQRTSTGVPPTLRGGGPARPDATHRRKTSPPARPTARSPLHLYLAVFMKFANFAAIYMARPPREDHEKATGRPRGGKVFSTQGILLPQKIKYITIHPQKKGIQNEYR